MWNSRFVVKTLKNNSLISSINFLFKKRRFSSAHDLSKYIK